MYALLLDTLERSVAAERQVAAVYLAAGAKGVTLPTYAVERARLDAQILAPLTEVSPLTADDLDLRRVLGVSA